MLTSPPSIFAINKKRLCPWWPCWWPSVTGDWKTFIYKQKEHWKLTRQIQIHTFLLSENQEMNHELYLPRSSTHSGEVGWFKCESINKLVTRPHEDLQWMDGSRPGQILAAGDCCTTLHFCRDIAQTVLLSHKQNLATNLAVYDLKLLVSVN